tara:strand:- start:925 stop:1599 length:675 start_codon:yes stop_codon:yes gene_type:complete
MRLHTTAEPPYLNEAITIDIAAYAALDGNSIVCNLAETYGGFPIEIVLSVVENPGGACEAFFEVPVHLDSLSPPDADPEGQMMRRVEFVPTKIGYYGFQVTLRWWEEEVNSFRQYVSPTEWVMISRVNPNPSPEPTPEPIHNDCEEEVGALTIKLNKLTETNKILTKKLKKAKDDCDQESFRLRDANKIIGRYRDDIYRLELKIHHYKSMSFWQKLKWLFNSEP